MSWISTISYQNANGKLRQLYDRVKGPNNNIGNIMMMGSTPQFLLKSIT